MASAGGASETVWTFWTSEIRQIHVILHLHFADATDDFQQKFHALFLMSGESYENQFFIRRERQYLVHLDETV